MTEYLNNGLPVLGKTSALISLGATPLTFRDATALLYDHSVGVTLTESVVVVIHNGVFDAAVLAVDVAELDVLMGAAALRRPAAA